MFWGASQTPPPPRPPTSPCLCVRMETASYFNREPNGYYAWKLNKEHVAARSRSVQTQRGEKKKVKSLSPTFFFAWNQFLSRTLVCDSLSHPFLFFNVRATPCENNQHILLPAKWKADLMYCKIQTASFGGVSQGDVEGLTFWCGELEGFGPVVAQSSERNSASLGCIYMSFCQKRCFSRHFSVKNYAKWHLLRNFRVKKNFPHIWLPISSGQDYFDSYL